MPKCYLCKAQQETLKSCTVTSKENGLPVSVALCDVCYDEHRLEEREGYPNENNDRK